MSRIVLKCRMATPFSTPEGGVDEKALRWYLSRLIESDILVCPGGGGVGETYTLTREEMRRFWEICVDECKGRTPIYANPGEQLTAKATLDSSRLALDAGCDYVNIYPIAGWHGMRARDNELAAYYDRVLTEINHEVLISVNPVTTAGLLPPAHVIATAINKHRNVIGVYLTSTASNEDYLLNLMDLVTREMDFHIQLPGCLNSFLLGAHGLTCVPANVIPKSYRQFIDLYEARDFEKLGPLHAGLLRFSQVVLRYASTDARWVKMCWHIFKLPGSVFHEPNMLPPEKEMQSFTEAILRVGLPEVDELARAAGLL